MKTQGPSARALQELGVARNRETHTKESADQAPANAPEVELARARRQFNRSLQRASGAGRELFKQIVVPAACTALVVGGAVLFLALRRAPQRSFALVTLTAPPPPAARWRALATTLAWTFGTRVLLPRLAAKLGSSKGLGARHPS